MNLICKPLLFSLFILSFTASASTGSDMVDAAKALLSSLTEDQKERMTFEVSDTSREIWHYLPIANFARFGVPLRELTDAQDKLVYKLLEVSLSSEGFNKTRQIMDLERVLQEIENDTVRRDPEQYHVAIYGTPSLDGFWAWSCSGHHVSLHFTMIDGQIASTPTFMGSNPAEVRMGPKQGLRVLKDEEDKGLMLVQSLTEAQKKVAVFEEKAPYEIFTAAQSKVTPLENQGIRFKDLGPEQQMQLKAIITEYAAVMPEGIAKRRLEKIDNGGWNEIRFAWAGTIDRSDGHYYRIQGPSFLIEFDNTQNDANHIHSVWRDFSGDFGRDILREHYKTSH